MNTSLHFSSAKSGWETPCEFFRKLDAEFHFTLDPACTHENAKCKKHFTAVENGLLMPWTDECVYLNPPYGRTIGHWMLKANHERRINRAMVVCLVPARTDTAWWHDEIMKPNHEVRFIRGRLKFGGHKNSAPFPSAVVVMRAFIGDAADCHHPRTKTEIICVECGALLATYRAVKP